MGTKKTEKLPPIHPGEHLLNDFMIPLGVSQNALARAIGMTPTAINEIVNGKRGISVKTSAKLARYFGTAEDWFTRWQTSYELDLLHDHESEELNRIKPLKPTAA